MQELQVYLLVGLLSSFLGSASILLVVFTLWICSLRTDLQVYAPLVDAPRTPYPRRLQESPSPRSNLTFVHLL